MHDVIGTDTGRRLELRARVASGVFFLVALLGLLLPWAVGSETGLDLLLGIGWSDMVRHPDWPGLVSVVALALLPLAGLALSIRGTRRMAVGRIILAAVGAVPLVFGFGLWWAFTGRPPDLIGGWVTFAAHVGAVVANCIAHRAWRRDRGEAGTDTAAPRREFVFYIASSVLFAAAVVGLFLPRGLEAYFGDRSNLVGVMVGIGLALGVRRTRRAAVARAIVAAAGAGPIAYAVFFTFALTGQPGEPGWTGEWVTFWALIGALVANVLAASTRGRPRTGRERPSVRISPGFQGP